MEFLGITGVEDKLQEVLDFNKYYNRMYARLQRV